uniref:Uncharacterized protein n=1 Tax=Klebsiella pneumoniae TaxID=573 RepID=A0A024HW39_KLEPN|nr:hypothetical protein PENVA_0295 [Klebsiella pneumoniae]
MYTCLFSREFTIRNKHWNITSNLHLKSPPLVRDYDIAIKEKWFSGGGNHTQTLDVY